MAGIPEHTIEEVKSRADIVEVVSGYIALKKAGSNYRALCPFHQEKTPSFNVNPAKQIFHCFGCGEGGNVFTFLMKYEKISFPEAVRLLASNYGIKIEAQGGRKNDEIEAIYKAMDSAANFYHRLLAESRDNSKVAQYIKKRGIAPELVERFMLGWAPDDWDSLYRHLSKAGFSDKTINAAGLGQPSSKGNMIDRFRGRLMFPISSIGGKVIAFGGRIIADNVKDAPKYINSPETPIYNKSRVLYGLNHAQTSARRNNAVVVVEGYMDVLALWSAGIENCAAVSGVAFTPGQAEAIKRIADSVIALFDADEAGLNAAKRSVPVLLDHRLSVKMLSLPGAKDPDEYLAANGPEQLMERVNSAPAFPAFIIDSVCGKADMSSIEGRTKAAHEIMPYLRRIKDNIERSQYVQLLSERAGIDEKVLARNLTTEGAPGFGGYKSTDSKKRSAKQNAERILVRILLDRPEYLDSLASDLRVDDFEDDNHKAMFEMIQSAKSRKIELTADIIDLSPDENIRKILTGLSMEKNLFDENDVDIVAEDCLKRVRYSHKGRKNKLEDQISAAKNGAKEKFYQAKKKYFEIRDN